MKYITRHSSLNSALGLYLPQAKTSPAQLCKLVGIPSRCHSGLLRLHPSVSLIEKTKFIQYFLLDQGFAKGPWLGGIPWCINFSWRDLQLEVSCVIKCQDFHILELMGRLRGNSLFLQGHLLFPSSLDLHHIHVAQPWESVELWLLFNLIQFRIKVSFSIWINWILITFLTLNNCFSY